jgi:hypothetical protein
LRWIVVGVAVLAAMAGVVVAEATEETEEGWEAAQIVPGKPCPGGPEEHGICIDVVGGPSDKIDLFDPPEELKRCMDALDYPSNEAAERAEREALETGVFVDCGEVLP